MDPFTITTLATAGLELGRAAHKAGRAKKLRGQYEAANRDIQTIDPTEIAFMGELKRREAAYAAGTDAITGYNQQQIRNTGAQTQENIMRGGGGVGDLLRSQRVTDQQIGATGASAQARADMIMGQRGQMVGAFAKRTFQRKMSEASRLWQEATHQREGSNASLQAGIAMLPQVAGGLGKKVTSPGSDVMTEQLSNYSESLGAPSSPATPADYRSPGITAKPAWWTGDTPPVWWQ